MFKKKNLIQPGTISKWSLADARFKIPHPKLAPGANGKAVRVDQRWGFHMQWHSRTKHKYVYVVEIYREGRGRTCSPTLWSSRRFLFVTSAQFQITLSCSFNKFYEFLILRWHKPKAICWCLELTRVQWEDQKLTWARSDNPLIAKQNLKLLFCLKSCTWPSDTAS